MPFFEQQWNNKYNELVDYKRINGNCNVPQRSSQLGEWVHTQRTQNSKGKFSEERRSRLKDLDFQWQLRGPTYVSEGEDTPPDESSTDAADDETDVEDATENTTTRSSRRPVRNGGSIPESVVHASTPGREHSEQASLWAARESVGENNHVNKAHDGSKGESELAMATRRSGGNNNKNNTVGDDANVELKHRSEFKIETPEHGNHEGNEVVLTNEVDTEVASNNTNTELGVSEQEAGADSGSECIARNLGEEDEWEALSASREEEVGQLRDQIVKLKDREKALNGELGKQKMKINEAHKIELARAMSALGEAERNQAESRQTTRTLRSESAKKDDHIQNLKNKVDEINKAHEIELAGAMSALGEVERNHESELERITLEQQQKHREELKLVENGAAEKVEHAKQKYEAETERIRAETEIKQREIDTLQEKLKRKSRRMPVTKQTNSCPENPSSVGEKPKKSPKRGAKASESVLAISQGKAYQLSWI